MVGSTRLDIKGVNVDFIGSYKYPLLLRKYRGYVIKEVSSISKDEIFESIVIGKERYLPIYVMKCSSGIYTKKKIENEKSQFNLSTVIVEIEKSVLDIENFKGVVLLDTSDSNLVCCYEFKVSGDKVIISGFEGNLQECVRNSLIFYNRRLVDLW